MNVIELSWTLVAGALVVGALVARKRESSMQEDRVPVRVDSSSNRRLRP
ncbi:MAG: hypothetical protein KGQ93_05160 [Cyanobacteria bacterium REEB459]|nr:hypothetical protein [Cyanobacteria bacterium REEB459]